ncbi:hydantoinase/oxoprolinase family protein [Paraburkholderia saeva]|uniref:hydantoinase/oxoprolinase family protein n=1 Tax=Paraburkholderia saeva TaxID=2777537 RepID=UPI001D510C17|nr:hydantoinase/oxoprolinase family protein [Paraburkholderia saeva]CAG4885852.1 Acetophenone carboxylase gamma subunit [Paraburkholderia saeva]
MLSSTDNRLRLRVGVDSGGTFTDICMFDEVKGDIFVWKVSSTPQDPSLGIANAVEQGLREVSRVSGRDADVHYFGHGTTVATNALIVGRGAETGLITTSGFRDVLELRRQKRDALYDLQTEKPKPIVSRDRRLEVPERVLFDGRVFTELDEEAVRAAARQLGAEGIRSIAVCFLFSYVNPEHELRARRIVEEEIPGAYVTVSHEVAREFREYERFSTTVVNAYLGPIMKNYLQRLKPRLDEIGVRSPVHLTQSNGGIISSESAQRFPARTVLSGPAAGVMGTLAIAEAAGFENLITFDMGGTSTDVSLIKGGVPIMSNQAVVHGHPLKLPMLDIHTVGAGGGSIAYVDAGGLLKVGPRSAAADPGPICFERGNNDEPTVTDANVVLQVLNPVALLNGRLPVNQAKAKEAIAKLGERLGLGVMGTAQGIISVVIANMAKAIRVVSVERGHDPRDYVMFGFGGAGPIHASRLARALDMPKIVIPKYPGIMCALGLLLTDLRTSTSLTRLLPLEDGSSARLQQGFEELDQQISRWFEEEEIKDERKAVTRTLDMRYGGQGFELSVPCPAGKFDKQAIELLREAFEDAHQLTYGYVAKNEAIQVTTLRVSAVGRVRKAEFQAQPDAVTRAEDAIASMREVWIPEAGGFTECPLFDREKLGPGHSVDGPAVINQMDSTTLVLPGQTARVDSFLNLIIEERS